MIINSRGALIAKNNNPSTFPKHTHIHDDSMKPDIVLLNFPQSRCSSSTSSTVCICMDGPWQQPHSHWMEGVYIIFSSSGLLYTSGIVSHIPIENRWPLFTYSLSVFSRRTASNNITVIQCALSGRHSIPSTPRHHPLKPPYSCVPSFSQPPERDTIQPNNRPPNLPSNNSGHWCKQATSNIYIGSATHTHSTHSYIYIGII